MVNDWNLSLPILRKGKMVCIMPTDVWKLSSWSVSHPEGSGQPHLQWHTCLPQVNLNTMSQWDMVIGHMLTFISSGSRPCPSSHTRWNPCIHSQNIFFEWFGSSQPNCIFIPHQVPVTGLILMEVGMCYVTCDIRTLFWSFGFIYLFFCFVLSNERYWILWYSIWSLSS